MNTLQLGQTYATRDGKGTGRVVADDMQANMPCAVCLKHTDFDQERVETYHGDGSWREDRKECQYDLIIPERKMRTVWLNVYADGVDAYFTEDVARADTSTNLIAIAYPVEVPAE